MLDTNSGMYLSSVGGVKRPAEGSKEEPSEKKNLPVVAKTFVSKTTNNRFPPTRTTQTSPKLVQAAAQVSIHVITPPEVTLVSNYFDYYHNLWCGFFFVNYI